jgi:singapore isolate B (sub-type 7) whole genome shotgun sequence assembly, scaffold_0
VSTEEGKKLAEKFGIPFAETSAQTNTNVDEAFMTLAEAVVKRKTEEAGALDYKAEKAETVKISSSDKKEGKKGCCK